MEIKGGVQPGDPAWLREAFKCLGMKEVPGKGNNPEVVRLYREAGHPEVKSDDVAWCAAFVGAMLARAGEPHTSSLAARSYLDWGKATTNPKRGDIVVFTRGSGWQGHVAFYLGESAGRVWVLGGNQGDKVSVTSYARSSVLGFRKKPTPYNSRTIAAQAVSGAGVVTAGVGQVATQAASMAGDLNDQAPGVADQLTRAGEVIQTVAVLSPWFYLAGATLILGGIGWTAYARYTDWREKAK
jgi:uncharacterized protein (TIGR02594 family)